MNEQFYDPRNAEMIHFQEVSNGKHEFEIQ